MSIGARLLQKYRKRPATWTAIIEPVVAQMEQRAKMAEAQRRSRERRRRARAKR